MDIKVGDIVAIDFNDDPSWKVVLVEDKCIFLDKADNWFATFNIISVYDNHYYGWLTITSCPKDKFLDLMMTVDMGTFLTIIAKENIPTPKRVNLSYFLD